MGCLTDAQIESLAWHADEDSPNDLWRHVESCSRCRRRVEHLLSGTDVVRDIQELRKRRERLKPLLERMHAEGGASGSAANDPI